MTSRSVCTDVVSGARRAGRTVIGLAVVLLPLASSLQSLPAHANVASVMPEFYSEPGLNPFRDQLADTANELIDPFSGSLQLSYVDLVVPGDRGWASRSNGTTPHVNRRYHFTKTKHYMIVFSHSFTSDARHAPW